VGALAGGEPGVSSKEAETKAAGVQFGHANTCYTSKPVLGSDASHILEQLGADRATTPIPATVRQAGRIGIGQPKQRVVVHTEPTRDAADSHVDLQA
jgi:hypothetical protein